MATATDIMIEPPQPGEMFGVADAFGENCPFELEIGCGKGGFLLRRAQEHPDVRLLGIEWANKYYRFAADRMARWGVTNVRTMRTDASNFVMHHLPHECLSVLHVYHPDPWPKKRHHKRRLFQKPFIQAAVRSLVPDGRWAIQTDHAEYFEWIKERVAVAENLTPIEYDDPQFGIVNASAATNFEIKYRQEGRQMYQLAYRKHGLADSV